uniref:Protein kinase domain-containing protein n=1 Tax=Labrus bergylta TaxID=56723 RepID=A0A3Q3NG57_9LABR
MKSALIRARWSRSWPATSKTCSWFSGQRLSRAPGRFSVVKRCDQRGTKRTVAVKHVNKKLMRRDRVTQELNLLQRLQHPHIVSLIDTYETPASYAADQGRLLDYIVSWGNLTEEKVACYLRDILEALHYLHNSRIVHLDVKVSSSPLMLFLLLSLIAHPTVKLTDFGDAVQLNSAHYVHPLLGSPEFASPELVLGEPVSLNSDMWSLGVVTYVLLSGASPFLDESAEETCLNICQLDFSFPRDYFQGVSQAARDFICLLLRTDPGRRPPAGLCLQEPWLQCARLTLKLKTNSNTQYVGALVAQWSLRVPHVWRLWSSKRLLSCKSCPTLSLPDF